MPATPSNSGRLQASSGLLGSIEALVFVVVGCSTSGYVPPVPEKPTGPLTLEAAVDLAVRNNPDLLAADQRIAYARGAIDEAISQYWPVLQFVETFTWTDTPSQAFANILDQQRFKQGIDFNEPGKITNWRTGLVGSITLYDGGRRRARYLMSVAAANSALAQAEAVRRDLALEVARAFFTIQKARETAAAQEKSIETLGTHLRITEAKQSEGVARRSDVLAVRVRLAETREASIVARNSAERALAGLRVLLGLDMDDPLEIQMPPQRDPGPREGLTVLLEKARAHRFELVKALEEVKMAEARWREALAGYQPEITLFGSFGFDDRTPFDFDYGHWTWGVSFLQSVFEILKTPNRVRQALTEVATAYSAARKVLLEVELDVKNAILDGDEADARHDVAAQAVELAEESLRLVEAEYKEGAATVTRLLEAELALTQARTRLSATTYDRALARIAVAHAAGEYPEPPRSEHTKTDEGTGKESGPPAGASTEATST